MYKLMIVEDPRSERTPRVLGPPLYLKVDAHNNYELHTWWKMPENRVDRVPPDTTYKVQWKEATGSWDNPADVSEEIDSPSPSTNEVLGHTIRGLAGGVEYHVRVIATNPVGDSEPSEVVSGTPNPLSALSQNAAVNTPAGGAPVIEGTAEVEQTLSAVTTDITDVDGLQNVVFTYRWLADDAEISGATGSSYTLVDAVEGRAIKVRVSFTDDAGNPETLTSTATASVKERPNSPATGAPTISGTAQVGEALTADTSGISDDDGMGNVTFAYQWLADDTEISGATDSSYTLTDGDVGETIKVRVSFTDDEGNPETVTSTATASVTERPNSPATGAPTISGTARVGETLTADTSGISDNDGIDNATFAYQWLADDSDIASATGSSYTLVDDDAGKTIKVRVSFTDDEGNAEALTSAATATVAERPNSPATGAPTISGTARVGETLTADTSGISDSDGIDNATFAYQWLADDTEISGATDSSYTLTDGDVGKTIRLRVSFTDDAENPETLTSTATTAVVDAVADVADAPAPVWSVEMTVVDYGHGDVGANSADLFSDETGSLSVVWLWYSARSRELQLAFTGPVADAEEFRLQLDDVSLAFPEGSSGAPNFTFRNVDISWTDGQVVAVSIVR